MRATRSTEGAYLYGPEIRRVLVAPVHHAATTSSAEWRHVWSDATFGGGAELTVDAPIGKPAVFYRVGSAFDGPGLRRAPDLGKCGTGRVPV